MVALSDAQPIPTPPEISTEIAKAPEKKTPSPENLKADVISLASSGIHQKQKATRTELEGKSGQEQRTILSQNKGKKAIIGLEDLESLKPGTINCSLTDKDSTGKDIPETDPNYNPIILTINTDGVEEKVIVKSIISMKEGDTSKKEVDSFDCGVEVIDGSPGTTRVIPRSQVILGYFKTESANILAEFAGDTEAEQKIIQLYIDSLNGQETITAENAGEITETVLEAAKGVCISSRSLKKFAEKAFPEAISENGNLTAEQRDQNDKRKRKLEEIDQILGDTNLPDENQVVEILKIGGFSEVKLELNSINADQALEQLEAQFKNQPSNNRLKEQVENAKKESRFCKMAIKLLKGDGLSKYFKAVQDGGITREKAMLLNEALEEGDMDKMLESLLPDLPPEMRALFDLKKNSGIMVILLGLVLNSFNQEFLAEQR